MFARFLRCLAVFTLLQRQAPSVADATGVVVVAVEHGQSAEQADIRRGDTLVAWSRAATPPANPEPAAGQIVSPFGAWAAEQEESPRGPVTLVIVRDGRTRSEPLPPGAWGLRVQPVMPADALARAAEAEALRDDQHAEAAALWRDLASRADLPASTRGWLAGEMGRRLDAAERWEEASAAYETALGLLSPRDRTLQLFARGRALRLQGEAQRARDALEAALREAKPLPGCVLAGAIHQELADLGVSIGGFRVAEDAAASALEVLHRFAPGSLLESSALTNHCFAIFARGDFEGAEQRCRSALAIREAVKPGGLEVADGLRWLGMVLRMRGRLDEAEEHFGKAAEMAQRLAPDSVVCARALGSLGLVARERGDFVKAASARLRAVAILERLGPSMRTELSTQYNGLGVLAVDRGDLDAAEDWLGKALEVSASFAPHVGRGMWMMNLGQVALRRGDLSKADDLFQRSLALYEPGSTFASWGLQARGEVAERRGQWQAAEAFNKEALAIITKHAPEGLDQAAYLQSLGRVAEGQGNLAGAEGFYHHALRIRQRLVSGTQFEAESLHGLGVVARKRGDLGTAEALLRRAADVLEIQKGRLGGAEDVQSRFAGSYSDFYQDLLELLVGRNDVASAFAVLERSRARRLLTLMAQRDLILDDEIPAPLERERRRVDADYERAKNELRQLSPEKNAADVARIVIRLRELRDAKADVADRIREASPRLAGFTDPRPLDAELLAASLEPGTLLLEYAVGKDATVLLMLGNATPAEAAVIPIGEARLAERVERWRRWAEQTAPPDEFFAEGRALYDLLVLPAERHVRRAQHLLVSPDGPLHRLPFAALQHDQAHLAERKALTVTPSGTISAQLARSRGSIASDVDLVAFGDPRIDGSRPLTASRREVEALAGLFPRSRAYLGDDASADRARAGLKHARYVHFACHGLIDERFPLDSALALAGSDGSGLLHAWEIFERVRLNADLVTLSACRSASGTSFAGEGLLGLTRAFQFAGARSVLASLWDTGDRSTLQIMTRFYALVKAGVSKDEALRRAQVEAIRRGWHPVRWANFQLYGDWR